jgi:hypothetical protein
MAAAPPCPAGVTYLPVDAKRRETFHSTLTVSNSALRMALLGNSSVPLGFESHDWGHARNAP